MFIRNAQSSAVGTSIVVVHIERLCDLIKYRLIQIIFRTADRSTDLIGLPISSHVTILVGSFRIILLFAFMAQLCIARNMLEKSKDVL